MSTPPADDDVRVFSHEHLMRQLETARFHHGYYVLSFYAAHGRPATVVTDHVAEFFLYPSGGTLRDASFNLVFYDSRYDTYRGFQPPAARGRD